MPYPLNGNRPNGQPTARGRYPDENFTNGPKVVPRFPTVTAAIMHHIRTAPDAVAAVDHSAAGHPQISYAELGLRSRHLMRTLLNAGVGPGERVPLVAKRGIDMLVGIVAILRCGAQYVPLDGGVTPTASLQRVVEQSASKAVVCLQSTSRRLDELELGDSKPVIIGQQDPSSEQGAEIQASDHDHGYDHDDEQAGEKNTTPESGCYVIYTSGKHLNLSLQPRHLLTSCQRHDWHAQGS